jgi:LIVCS family branched-chain amino acid:cation transporter
MFFGAGNLVFPLLIGHSTQDQVWPAIAGLSLTAVVLPFLGLCTMILLGGQLERFFGVIGKIPGTALLLILQLILGPFGVIPRLFTLMHATAKLYLFDLGIFPFSLTITALILLSSFKREKIVGLLGSYLTPPLIGCLIIMILAGLIRPTSAWTLSTHTSSESFFEGLLCGYNMMDLIAALPFATLVLLHFSGTNSERPSRGALMKKMAVSSLIAGVLLLLTYIGLCLIAARHSIALGAEILPEEIVGALAGYLLGNTGGLIAALLIMTSCMTTAVTLTANFSNYLRIVLCKSRISPSTSLLSTLALTTCFATLGFNGIASLLSPLLQVLYPATILLTLVNLLRARQEQRFEQWGIKD